MTSERSDWLQQIITSNAGDVLAYLERRVRPAADAADLLSEVMLVAWRRRARVPRDPRQARMWLFGVARMTLGNHDRGALRRDRLAARLRSELELAARCDEAAGSEDRATEVREAIASLPPDLAELVRLVHWDGFSLNDAAQLLELNPSTARGRYQRARELLAQSLRPAAVEAGVVSARHPATGHG